MCSEATGTYTPHSLAYDFELYDQTDVKVRTEVVDGCSPSEKRQLVCDTAASVYRL